MCLWLGGQTMAMISAVDGPHGPSLAIWHGTGVSPMVAKRWSGGLTVRGPSVV